MANYLTQSQLRETILRALKTKHECGIDELVNTCSDFTWKQVFREVDQLRRSGLVHLRIGGPSGYTLTVSREPWTRVARSSHDADQAPTR